MSGETSTYLFHVQAYIVRHSTAYNGIRNCTAFSKPVTSHALGSLPGSGGHLEIMTSYQNPVQDQFLIQKYPIPTEPISGIFCQACHNELFYQKRRCQQCQLLAFPLRYQRIAVGNRQAEALALSQCYAPLPCPSNTTL